MKIFPLTELCCSVELFSHIFHFSSNSERSCSGRKTSFATLRGSKAPNRIYLCTHVRNQHNIHSVLKTTVTQGVKCPGSEHKGKSRMCCEKRQYLHLHFCTLSQFTSLKMNTSPGKARQKPPHFTESQALCPLLRAGAQTHTCAPSGFCAHLGFQPHSKW